MRRENHMKKYPFTKQQTIKDCAAACVSMIIKYYHGYIPDIKLRSMLKINQNGTTAYHITEVLKSLGFNVGCKKEKLKITKVPFIAHTIIKEIFYHFVVIYEVNSKYIIMADPMEGIKKIKIEEFKKIWTGIKIEMYPLKPIPKENKAKKINIIKVFKPKDILLKILPLSLLIIITSVINTFFFAATLENIYLGIAFIVLFLINIIAAYYRNNHIVNIINKIISKIRYKTYKNIIKLPYEYYENYKTGEVISYLNEVPVLEKFYASFLFALTSTLPLFIVSTFALYIINTPALKLIVITDSIYLLVTILYNKKLKGLIEKNQIASAELNAFTQETISNYGTVKGINIENKIIKLFTSKQRTLISGNKSLSKFINKEYLIQNILLDITKALIIIYGIYLYNEKIIYLNALITTVMLVNLIQDAVLSASELNLNFKQAIQTFIKLEELNINASLKPSAKTTQIEIKNLCHTFNEITKTLNNINLKISHKEKILIAGKSGSGKSTLFKILKGYYPYQGQILINGKPFKENKPKIIYITCKSAIFSGTIDQNITIKSKENLKIIKEICCLEDVVKDKELKYNTLIEEDGNNISDGQRQRISLARSLHNFDVLVIDEALNATDINLERKILKQLLKHFKNKIIIFITHRLDNLDLFDRYIKMDRGEIVLDETYNEKY